VDGGPFISIFRKGGGEKGEGRKGREKEENWLIASGGNLNLDELAWLSFKKKGVGKRNSCGKERKGKEGCVYSGSVGRACRRETREGVSKSLRNIGKKGKYQGKGAGFIQERRGAHQQCPLAFSGKQEVQRSGWGA